jgi:hypothetical protein
VEEEMLVQVGKQDEIAGMANHLNGDSGTFCHSLEFEAQTAEEKTKISVRVEA